MTTRALEAMETADSPYEPLLSQLLRWLDKSQLDVLILIRPISLAGQTLQKPEAADKEEIGAHLQRYLPHVGIPEPACGPIRLRAAWTLTPWWRCLAEGRMDTIPLSK